MSLKEKHHYDCEFWCRCLIKYKGSWKAEEDKKFTMAFPFYKPCLSAYEVEIKESGFIEI